MTFLILLASLTAWSTSSSELKKIRFLECSYSMAWAVCSLGLARCKYGSYISGMDYWAFARWSSKILKFNKFYVSCSVNGALDSAIMMFWEFKKWIGTFGSSLSSPVSGYCEGVSWLRCVREPRLPFMRSSPPPVRIWPLPRIDPAVIGAAMLIFVFELLKLFTVVEAPALSLTTP